MLKLTHYYNLYNLWMSDKEYMEILMLLRFKGHSAVITNISQNIQTISQWCHLLTTDMVVYGYLMHAIKVKLYLLNILKTKLTQLSFGIL